MIYIDAWCTTGGHSGGLWLLIGPGHLNVTISSVFITVGSCGGCGGGGSCGGGGGGSG